MSKTRAMANSGPTLNRRYQVPWGSAGGDSPSPGGCRPAATTGYSVCVSSETGRSVRVSRAGLGLLVTTKLVIWGHCITHHDEDCGSQSRGDSPGERREPKRVLSPSGYGRVRPSGGRPAGLPADSGVAKRHRAVRGASTRRKSRQGSLPSGSSGRCPCADDIKLVQDGGAGEGQMRGLSGACHGPRSLQAQNMRSGSGGGARLVEAGGPSSRVRGRPPPRAGRFSGLPTAP